MNAFWNYWGKARPIDGSAAAFHLLPYHCLDVAAVGAAYLEGAPGLCRWLTGTLGAACEHDLVAWISFWLCLHDLGKYSEAFQGQRPDVFQRMRGRAPTMSYTMRHDTLGRVAWTELLEQIAIDDEWLGPLTEDHDRGLRAWVRAVTGHHGQPPKSDPIRLEHHFDKDDSAAILAFVREVKSLTLGDAQPLLPTQLDADAFCDASERLSWWIAGLAVLADWIGSNTEYFSYRDQPPADGRLEDYWVHAKQRAVVTLAATGMLPAAALSSTPLITLFPKISRPLPLQAWITNRPLSAELILVILEDVTARAKTEAAVMLAHRMRTAGSADGFFVGLPTMATPSPTSVLTYLDTKHD